MKTMKMARDFSYCPIPQVTMFYRSGAVYERVPESAVAAILKAKAGSICIGKAKSERPALQSADE